MAIFFSRQLEIWFIGKGLSLVLVSQTVKKSPAVQEMRVQSLGQEDPLEKGMQPAPGFLPEESHGQRSLAGCSPQGRTESDTTELLTQTDGQGLGARPPARLSGAWPHRWRSRSPPGPQCLLPDPRASARGVGVATETPGTQVWLGGCGPAVETRKERSLK